MGKKILSLTVAVFMLAVPAFAMGGRSDCPVFNGSPLINDDSSWSGIKYGGLPVRWGTDAVGYNSNYIFQVYIETKANGSSMVQIFTGGKPTLAFNSSKLNNASGPIGVSTITFQDSGIVMPKANYSSTMLQPTNLSCTWNITGVYYLNPQETVDFKNGFSAWNSNKLPNSSGDANHRYYYK